MTSLAIKPGKSLHGEVKIPADKSMTHRALIFSALAKGESSIENPLACEDTFSTVNILKELGVEVDRQKENRWLIRSPGLHAFLPVTKDLDAGNSGTTCRLLLGILAAQNFPSVLTGDESLSRRPMNRVLAPLQRMGARFESQNGHLPIKVLAATELGLRPIHYESPVASAQVKSACLLAGLYAHGVTSISEPRKSRDHTERMLSSLIPVNFREEKDEKSGSLAKTRFVVEIAGPIEKFPTRDYQIPGDFSSAAFFLVAASMIPGSALRLAQVGVNPTRMGLWDVLLQMGAKLSMANSRNLQEEPVADLTVEYQALRSVHLLAEETLRSIDEMPIWALAASQGDGVSVLSDAQELRVKESDRLEAMAENLKRLGIQVEGKSDGLVIKSRKGPFIHPKESGYGPGYLESFGDHRIAMSMCVAALYVEASKQHPAVEVVDTDCITTSFPQFYEILMKATQNG